MNDKTRCVFGLTKMVVQWLPCGSSRPTAEPSVASPERLPTRPDPRLRAYLSFCHFLRPRRGAVKLVELLDSRTKNRNIRKTRDDRPDVHNDSTPVYNMSACG